MRSGITHIICLSLLLAAPIALSQTWRLQGQASTWLKSNPGESVLSQAGFRYIPEFSLGKDYGDDIGIDLEFSLNASIASSFPKNQEASPDGRMKPYRGWLRFSSRTFEARIGLQKINFGSATLFRPLMWFDRIDPRDPLQLSDGVYGLLLRDYFLDNTTVWLWGLYGNNGTKGWEVIPTKRNSFEEGCRVQTPLSTGEIGVTYHHRQTDLRELARLSNINENFAAEDRLGLDGKWDAGMGIWFEAALLHVQREIPRMKYQRNWTIGSDYTFDVGNGVNATIEYFRSEQSDRPFAQASGLGLAALSLSYALDIIDRLSLIVYRDWTHHEWYRLITWQSTYDNWIIYLLGFWNPKNIQIYGNQAERNPLGGTGIQLIIVFNH